MKNLLFLMFCLIFTASCSEDDDTGNITTSQPDITEKFVGKYNGHNDEDRELDIGLEQPNSYKSSLEISKISDHELEVILKLCHSTDGLILLELLGDIDPDDEETFSIRSEDFYHKVDGQLISITGGSGRYYTEAENLEVKFKERRTFLNDDPSDDDQQYKSDHMIGTNRKNTGQPGC